VRCSDCSAVLKPVVAIDIDGTLADYHGPFLDFAVAYVGQPRVVNGAVERLMSYDGGESFKSHVIDALGIDNRTWHDIKLAYRQGAMKRSLPIYPHAAGLCQSVRDSGAELWLTTTRPYFRLDNIDPDTREWLRRHNISYDGLLYEDDKYKVLSERLDAARVVAVLDDLPEQVEAARRVFGWRTPLFRGNPWNTAIRGERYDLLQAEAVITKRVNNWKDSTHE
jgi:hypothetical protein